MKRAAPDIHCGLGEKPDGILAKIVKLRKTASCWALAAIGKTTTGGLSRDYFRYLVGSVWFDCGADRSGDIPWAAEGGDFWDDDFGNRGVDAGGLYLVSVWVSTGSGGF
jgi:hypothetical protein